VTGSASVLREPVERSASAARDLLAGAGVERWEVFAKASSTRRVEVHPDVPPESMTVEELGVAVRTFHDGRAGFGAASGGPLDAARRAVEGAISSEVPSPVDPIPPPRLLGVTEIAAPRTLAPAGWAAHVCDQLAASITETSGGALRLRRSVVQEGAYQWLLTTREEFRAEHENASTSLLAEVQLDDERSGVWREWAHIAAPLSYDPTSLAERIANRVLLSRHRLTSDSGLRDLILDPEVTSELLSALSPLFLARPTDRDPLPGLLDRNGELATSTISIVDDRVDPGAPITGPCDGEGLPAMRTLLVESGVPRHRLASWRDSVSCSEIPRGGALRLSYRDYPSTGFANLRIVPDDGLPPGRLLEIADRALYLLRPLAPPWLDPVTDAYRIIASGVWLRGTTVRGWHPVVELRGSISRLLRRIDAVGADPTWFQTDRGCVAAPTLLVRRQPVVG
jgi:predicted Zn-dependent protease